MGSPQLAVSLGMRVRMADGYKARGDGTVVDEPELGVCSVSWDSGLNEVSAGWISCCDIRAKRYCLAENVLAKRGDALPPGASAAWLPTSSFTLARCEQACVFAGKHGLYQLVSGKCPGDAAVLLCWRWTTGKPLKF